MKSSVYVGIGASAGGLKAFEKLVGLLPSDKGYVYIIAQHLDPNKRSSLVKILSHHTTMPVWEIDEECKFLPNNIYIIPSQYNLVIKKHRLRLEKVPKVPHIPTPSIDKLFESLALYKKEHSIAIVLAGTGHDGTLGIKKIKENGGVTIAQSPKEASHKGMPQSAIDTQNIDYILSLEQMAENLSSIVFAKEHSQSTVIHDMPDQLKIIQKLLAEKENLNIKKYKNETIMRRINKRMILVCAKTLDEYLAYINTHPTELHLLYQNILIGVTTFFRDKKAFKTLERELFLYLKDKPENYELRVWSIACSTGEEAYSLAILISEIGKQLNKTFDLHIFATDIDDNALEKARTAIYTQESISEIDKNLLDEYFTYVDGGYKVIESIRKQIVFTHHNILSDPPFINQDIISCRNLLIYILPEVQQEIFTLFHYTLKEHGILFLGSSESTLLSMKYFTSLNSEYKIYTKEKLKNPPKISSHYFSKHLEEKNDSSVKQIDKTQSLNIEEQISDAVFDFFAPSCIVIDKDFSIIYKKGELPFISMPDGFVTLNLLENLDKTLLYDVRRLLSSVFASRQVQTTKFIEVALSSSQKTFVRVIAYPFNAINSTSMILLYFQQLDAQDLQFNTSELILPNESFVIKNLTTQLAQAQEDNHSLLDELTISKENMQLLNEELQSSNEELQSSNEELETSNEELQSSNEELHASILNEQILQKQLSMILNSTQEGIIGLDINGNHIFVNDATVRILGFSKDELIGKNAHKVWHHTKPDGSHYPFEECKLHHELINARSLRAEEVFWKKDGTPLEVEVLQNPIIEDKKVAGAVLSFHDVTEQNRLKKEAEHEHRLAELYMNVIGTLVMTLDLNGNITMINKEGCKLLGLQQDEAIGKNFIDNFIPEKIRSEIKGIFNSIASGEKQIVAHYKNTIVDTNNQEHLVAWTNNFIKDINGNITGVITSGIDITKEEKLSQKLFEQEHLYKLTFEEADIGIAHVSLDGKWIDTNEYLSNILGYTKDEFKKMTVSQITYSDDINTDKRMMKQLLDRHKNSYHIEKRYIHKNGNIIWVSLAVVVLKDDIGKPLYFLKIIRDISQLKLLMYQLAMEKDRFKKIIEFTPIPIMLYTEDGEIILINRVFRESTGYTHKELSTINNLIQKLFMHQDETTIEKLKEYYNNPITKEIQQQTIITKSGEKRTGILNAVKLYNTDVNNKNLYLIAIIDVTDIQNKDELMIAQSRQAAMGDMLAMIAHQWRQPLSVISMVSNNIQAQIELEEEITPDSMNQLITTLNEQTQYLSHTIDDFRDFFKPDKVKETLSVGTILEKLTSLIQKSLENNYIKLELPTVVDVKISTYPNQLVQTLINLINNAKDAIKEHTPTNGLIRITIGTEKDEVIIGVCDNGGGIDPSVKDKLGQPYVTTKSKNGTGLGLYMSTIIVSKHLGGRLYWESDNVGSCFYIALPT